MRLNNSNKNFKGLILSDEIKKIVDSQTNSKNNKSEYIKQFDELSFSKNNSLTPNNYDNNSYSLFEKVDNDINDNKKLWHNNMIPYTSKRDTYSSNKSQRKLETFTGIFDNYTSKTEKLHLFDPMKDLTFVHGMPSSYITSLQDRLYTSNKNNNGDLPFQYNVKVRPGINNLNQNGHNSVYRINPPDIDKLKIKTNKKISYNNKPLITCKKGDVRGIDANITKFKIPDFREQNFSDLLPNKFYVEANKVTGEYTNVSSQRNEEDNFIPGPPIYLSMGIITQPLYEESKKINLFNDFTHSTNAVNNKPVLTNIKSFTNYDTQRTTTNEIDLLGPSTFIKSVYTNITDQAKETMRVTPNIITNTNNIEKSVYANLTDQAKETMRNMPNIITNTNNIEKSVYANLTDQAKDTMRNMPNIITNTNNLEKSVYTNLTDQAKETMRNMPNIITNTNNLEKYVYTNLTDQAKETMRNMPNIITNTNILEKSVYTNLTDEAKETMRNMPNIITNTNNLEKSVYTNLTDQAKDTMRNMPSIITNTNNLEKSVYTNLTDEARGTMRNMPNIITNSINLEKSIYSNLTDVARETMRNMPNVITNSINLEKSIYSNLTDIAKPTIKETTVNTYQIGSANKNDKLNYTVDYNDIAKNTIKQTTIDTQFIGSASKNDKLNYTINYNDTAKPTIKQTTEITKQIGSANKNDKLNYTIDYKDYAKPTIKQTTLINNNIVGVRKEILDENSHLSANNMTIDDRREISTYNQTSNGVRDLNGPYINKKTVKLIDPILYSYSGPPIKRLDNNIMPNDSENNYDIQVDKNILENNFNYNVNFDYISTLNNNPLVNDIFHIKNL